MSYWDGQRWTVEPGTEPARPHDHPLRNWIATIVMVGGVFGLALPSSSINAAAPILTLASSTAAAGTSVTVTGSDFARQTRVQLTFDGSATGMPAVNTAGQGRFKVRITVPPTAPGWHTIAAVSLADPSRRQANAAVVGLVLSSVLLSVSPGGASPPAPVPSSTPTIVPIPTATPRVSPTPSPTSQPTATPTPSPTVAPSAPPAPTPVPSPVPTPVPSQPPSGRLPLLTFGMGPESDGAINDRLVTEAPVGILSNWYHSPSDLVWMTDAWHKSLYAGMYAQGFDLHLIVWANVPEVTIPTAYGPACGRAYPLSPTFLDDMRALARTFAGSGTLYVTLFTEFQTYGCKDNAWNPDPATNAYYRALKDQYLAALAIFHELAPNSRVSIGWGGWMVGWADPATGAGRDMIPHFEDVMRASDFVSFQAMMNVPGGNAFDIRGMTRLLGAYGPVMLAHHMPDSDTCPVFQTDLQTLLTDAEMTGLVNDGLFAWSFMNDNCLDRDPTLYEFTRAAVARYAN